MRSEGQVRFIKISSRMQIAAAAVVALLLLAWLATIAAVSVMQFTASRDRIALIDREAQVAAAAGKVSEYRDSLDSVASDLSRRQNFIEKMVEAHIGDLPEGALDGETVSDSSDEAVQSVKKISSVLPEAAGLVRIEANQLAFVERLTRYADRKSEEAAAAIRKLGLNPNALLASAASGEALGGPYLSLATDRDGSLDPRFQRLGVSLARMEALERSLAGIPQVQPASMEFISSGFGYRSDPFKGTAAFHSGLDFRGPRGAPIYAAANGKISFAGVRQGYGKCIEIDHGNGLMTRYAHMSAFAARTGQKVEAGQRIGAIGNTGRSTGPHLHFEVRIHDRAVNPRPFLEAATRVQQEIRSGR